MSTPQHQVAARAAELRAVFDHGFAAPPPPLAPPQLDLLAIRCADHGFALRLSEVVAVYTERKIVPVPSPVPELLGLVGVRGLVAPVYDLRSLLGYGTGAAPRWRWCGRPSRSPSASSRSSNTCAYGSRK
jgi:hypothetical protein